MIKPNTPPAVALLASILAVGAAACGGESLAPGGGTTDTLTFGSEVRVFDLYVSNKVSRDTPAPLLFALHQTSPRSDGAQMRELSGFDAVADSLGFLVVYPDAMRDNLESERTPFLTYLILALNLVVFGAQLMAVGQPGVVGDAGGGQTVLLQPDGNTMAKANTQHNVIEVTRHTSPTRQLWCCAFR